MKEKANHANNAPNKDPNANSDDESGPKDEPNPRDSLFWVIALVCIAIDNLHTPN